MDNTYVNLNTPASGYESQLADIVRRQKYAELLAQQGASEIDAGSVGGVPTPISPFQGLAKVFQSGMGAYLSGQATKDQAALEASDNAALLNALKNRSTTPDVSTGGYQTTLPGVTSKGVTLPDVTLNGVTRPGATLSGITSGPYNLDLAPVKIPGYQRSPSELASYDLEQAGSKAMSKANRDVFLKSYTADQASVDALNKVTPQVNSILADPKTDPAVKQILTAALASGDIERMNKILGTIDLNAVPKAPSQIDKLKINSFNDYNNNLVAQGKPPISYDDYGLTTEGKKFNLEQAARVRAQEAIDRYQNSLGGKPTLTEKLKQDAINAWKAIPGNENGTVAQYDAYAAGLLASAQTTGRIGATLSAEGAVPIDDPAVVAITSQLQNGSQVTVPPHLKNAVDRRMASLGDNAYTAVGAARLINNAKSLSAPYLKLPEYQALASVATPLNRIKAAMQAGHNAISDQDMIDAMTQLSKASLTARAVTDSQVKLITGYSSWSDMASRYMNRVGGRGGALSDQQRKDIVKLSSNIAKEYQNIYGPVYNDLTTKLKANNIPEKFWPVPDLLSIQSNGKSVPIGSNGPVPARAKMSQAEWNTLEPDEAEKF